MYIFKIDPEHLEECAIEMWAVGNDPKGWELTPYKDLPEDYKQYYRRVARAIITKYLLQQGS